MSDTNDEVLNEEQIEEEEGVTGAPPPLPWERQEGETKRAFDLFRVYRDMGPTRTLHKTVSAFYGEEGEDGWTAGRMRFAEYMSSQWRWRKRCEAWDLEQERLWHAELAVKRKEAAERHVSIAKLVQSRALDRFRTLAAAELTPSEARLYFDLSVKIERLALGESTENLQHGGDADRPIEVNISARERLKEKIAAIRERRATVDRLIENEIPE